MLEKEKKENWILTGIFLALTAVSILFSVLCLEGTGIVFLQEYKALFIVLAILLLLALCGICVWFVFAKKEVLAKTFISIYVFLLFCLICIYVFQRTGFFEVVESSEKLQAYLEKSGAWMPIFYIVLQYLQVILLPIPSVVSTVAGVALFGAFNTFLYSMVGILLGSITGFFIGRKLGDKTVAWIVGRDTLTKWKKKLKGKDNFILTAMFLLPLFPDDVLCFVAGLSSMTVKYFLIMILITRSIGISSTCFSFGLIPFDVWWGLLIWAVLFALIITAFFLFYKYMDKIQAWWKNRNKKD